MDPDVNFAYLSVEHQEAYLALLAELSPVEPITNNQFFEFLIRRNQEIWVLEKDCQVLACGSLYFVDKLCRGSTRVAFIEDIVVHQSVRGQGLGRKMINHLVQRARANYCYKCVLSSQPELIDFYQKCGFQAGDQSLKLYLK
jgi:glucosamine-phosphate N-acetyltransferase